MIPFGVVTGENVEAAVFGPDVVKEQLGLIHFRVVDLQRDANPTPTRNFLRCFFNRAGNPVHRPRTDRPVT